MLDSVAAEGLIGHVSDLPSYSPPAHHGVVNRRIVSREFGRPVVDIRTPGKGPRG
jgi:hypothetical protein